MVNGALTDSLNGRFSALYDYSDGHQENLFTDLDILFNLHGGTDKSEPLQYKFHGGINTPGCTDNLPIGGSPDPANCPDDFGYTFANSDPHVGEWDWDQNNDITQTGLTITLNWDLGWGTLTSISNWEDYDRERWVEDEDMSPTTNTNVTFNETIEQYSQELRLSGQTDRLFWVTGLYYGKDKLRMNRSILGAFGFLDLLYANRINNEAMAVFGHAEYSFTDQWKLVAGIRYTKEDKDFVLDNELRLIPEQGGDLLDPWCDPDTCSSVDSWKEPSGKLAIEYAPADNALYYLSYSRGFKSGGYPGGVTTSPVTFIAYDPEFVDAWEAGFKSEMSDNRFRLNGAFFYYDYKDRQEFTWIPSSGGGATDFNQAWTNAGQAEILGAELEMMWVPVDRLVISLGLGLLDTEYKDFVLPPDLDPNDLVQSDLTGHELPFSPDVTLNGQIGYEWPLESGSAISTHINFQYVDEMWYSSQNINYEAGTDYSVWNGRLQWTSADDRWVVAAWVKNLFDEDYRSNAFISPENSLSVVYGMPRTYGLNMIFNWGR